MESDKSAQEFAKKVKEFMANYDLIVALHKEMDPFIRNYLKKRLDAKGNRKSGSKNTK